VTTAAGIPAAAMKVAATMAAETTATTDRAK
jgi:hypothetical protein